MNEKYPAGQRASCLENSLVYVKWVKIGCKLFFSASGGNWTWGGAKSMCEDLGAIMAAPNTDEEFEYFLSLGASTYFWLGSSDSDNEGTWVNLDGTNYEGPWGPKRPNDLDGSADCMNLLESKDGELFINDADCEQSGEGAVCARLMMNHPKCAPGWSLYNGVCFNRILGVVNYTEAEYLCHSYDSFLASLADIGQMVSMATFPVSPTFRRFLFSQLYSGMLRLKSKIQVILNSFLF